LSYKLMFDTSVFNFIDQNNLYSDIESFFAQNKNISVYICDTQVLEIDSISDFIKRDRIRKTIQNISVQNVHCSFGYVGTDNPSRRLTDRGSSVGKFRVADMDESKHQEIEELKRENPDATILDTAITEEMNYLVTRDRLMKTRLPERLNKVRIYSKQYPELKIELIKEKEDLMSFLNRL
jgi:predicted nucleic acid-binding protein